MPETTEDLLAQLDEAQELLRQAKERLDSVAQAQPAVGRRFKAYLVDHLETMISPDHNFVGRDLNLDDWKRELEEADSETPESETEQEACP